MSDGELHVEALAACPECGSELVATATGRICPECLVLPEAANRVDHTTPPAYAAYQEDLERRAAVEGISPAQLEARESEEAKQRREERKRQAHQHPALDAPSVSLKEHGAYENFIRENYPDDSLLVVASSPYRWNRDLHYWQHTTLQNLEAEVLNYLEQSGTVAALERSKRSVKAFFGNVSAFVKRHNKRDPHQNPFQESAVSPWLAFQNGAVELRIDGSHVWHIRTPGNESLFRNLYPLSCAPYDFDPALIGIDLRQSAPVAYNYLMSIIPLDLLSESEREAEVMQSLRFFSEHLAYTLSPIKRRPYFTVLVGKQDAGKTTYARLHSALVGLEFVVRRALSEMVGNRFGVSDLHGAKLFVDDDLNANEQLPDQWLKNNSGEFEATIERKFEAPLHGVKLSVTTFLLANYQPAFAGRDGMERRAIFIPFKNSVPRDKIDPFLIERITGEYPGSRDERAALVAFALQGWQSLVQRGFFFEPPRWIASAKEEWLSMATSVAQFVGELIDHEQPEYGVKKKAVYVRYQAWAKESGFQPVGKRRFYEEMRKLPGIQEGVLNGYEVFKLRLRDGSELQIEVQDDIPI